jgi:MFS family permease
MTEQRQDTMQTLPSRYKVRRSLRLSVLDAAAYSAMAGLTQNYITPFALALKATTMQIGLLSSAPSFTMALAQLATPNLSERAGSRKGFILPVVFMHALMWLPILLIPFVFPVPKVWWLIGFITLSGVLDSMANPAWGSMMADLVREEVRGRYFSFRGRIAGFITLIFSFIGGGVLQLFTGNGFVGFVIIFSGAMLFRLLSLYFLSGMYEPPISYGKGSRQSLLHMVRRLGSSNLGRFILYVALINFATNIAGPFFAVYMLRDLKFNYVTYMVINSFTAIATLFFVTFWGRRADLAGNMKVIRVTSFLLPLVPLVWLVSYNTFYLMGAQILSGFAWSGFNLAIVNFVYDASEPENRTKQIALFNSIVLVASCLGALTGGYLAPHLPAVLGFQLRTLFTISGVLRALVVVSLLRLIFEVRRVPKISFVQFLLGRSGSRS